MVVAAAAAYLIILTGYKKSPAPQTHSRCCKACKVEERQCTVSLCGCVVICSDFLRLSAPLFCATESEQQQDARRLADTLTGRTFAAAIDKLPAVSSSTDLSVDAVSGPASSSSDAVGRGTGAFSGGAVLLTRVKCLVSMTTPRDVRLHGAAITPSFVEFDMQTEGFGCLYLPSIAPQGPVTPSVVSAGMIGGTDQTVVTGIGTGTFS